MTDEEMKNARKVDLLSYLERAEPEQLVRVSQDCYCTREHDSLKISNGKWYWFSRGTGGVSAIDYLITVRGMTLKEAAAAVKGACGLPDAPKARRERRPGKKLALPEKNGNADRVKDYLRGRGIHPEVIGACIESGILYESAHKHNAVFVGMDLLGRPGYAAVRGTAGDYKSEAPGSDKRCSFRIEGRGGRHLHLFESAIDLMSYATLARMKGRDWREDSLLSLGGVYRIKDGGEPPAVLSRFLDTHPETKTVHLHLDADEAGRAAAEGIAKCLAGRYRVYDEPPVCGKDVNDQLMLKLGLKKRKEERER